MNDAQVKRLLKSTDKRKLYGTDTRGLYLRISPTKKGNVAQWFHRWTISGKQHMVKLGDFPEMKYIAARDQLEGERNAIREDKLVRSVDQPFASITHLVEQYGDHISDTNARWNEELACLRNHLLPTYGDTQPASLTPGQVHTLLAKQTGSVRNKLLFTAKQAWQWALDQGRVQGNPWAGIKKTKTQPRQRKLKGSQLKTFVTKLDATSMLDDIILFTLLTGQRRNEVIKAESAEFDLDHNLWTIPGTRTKNRRMREQSASAQAKRIVEKYHGDQKYLFVSERTQRPVNDVHVAAYLRDQVSAMGLPRTTLHDLRRTMGTWLAEHGTPMEVIGHMLNHTPTGVTASFYAQASYTQPAAEAWQGWADAIDEVRQPRLRSVG